MEEEEVEEDGAHVIGFIREVGFRVGGAVGNDVCRPTETGDVELVLAVDKNSKGEVILLMRKSFFFFLSIL